MKFSTIVPRPLRRLKQMRQENRDMMERLAALERSLTEKRPESTTQQDLLEQQVRFLLAENIRLNQVLRELIYCNHLKRSATGLQTKESFDYQWREVGEGKWMPSNPEFLHTTPDLVLEWTQLPRAWFAGKRALDVGCGSGRWTYALRKLGAHVTAMDQSSGGLAETRALVARDGLGPVELHQQDVLEWALDPHAFDLVWCYGVAHHTENPLQAIQNVLAAVVPGGYLFMMLYAFPESKADDYRAQASYLEWRRRLLPLAFAEKVEILKQQYPPELVHGYFDAYSPPINDLFTWEWIQAFLQQEGFDSMRRVPGYFNH